MSVIVAECDGIQSVVGGDSAIITPGSSELYRTPVPKVFQARDYVVGFCGSLRAGQVLQHVFKWPDPPAAGDLAAWGVEALIPGLREVYRQEGLAATSESKHQGGELGYQFVVAWRGSLVEVSRDFCALPIEGYTAIGEGRLPAYGALFVLAEAKPSLSLEERVRAALEASASYTSSVRPPFTLLSTSVADAT